ncbi:Protein PLASTID TRANSCRIPTIONALLY ACTIVE 14 [Coccomyxa sp. Obi]|nr:Protein PLASTID TRANSCRIPTIONALLY ACTIVE 14 [Coccomyxa sp. Obi]
MRLPILVAAWNLSSHLTSRLQVHSLSRQHRENHGSHPRKHHRRTSVECTNATDRADGALAAFRDLLEEIREQSAVEMRRGHHGNGLYLTRSVIQGEVIMRVPMEYCLVVNYDGDGLSLPNFAWPRLREAVQDNPELPWDLLLAVALLDAYAGDGGAFWQHYARELLPAPASLSLPFCLPQDLLEELQHEEVLVGAQKQQERLTAMLPQHAQPTSPSGCTWMQWAFACVRSRVFQLGPGFYAFVPFMDMANHALPPVAAFRPHGNAVELVAIADATEGDEATISYAPLEGHSNQRLMQQYGFVIEGGNPADRLHFTTDQADSDAPDRPSEPDETLSLARIEYLLGDQIFLGMMAGEHPYLTAAIKSLPLREGGNPGDPVPVQERQLAERLISTCEEILQGGGTTLEEDCSSRDGAADARMAAALTYRIERKALARTAHALLTSYIADRAML